MELCVTREVGTLEIFITKICMKVPGIWHKKHLEKKLEFRTKNFEKTWNLVFGKKWESCYKKGIFFMVLGFCGQHRFRKR